MNFIHKTVVSILATCLFPCCCGGEESALPEKESKLPPPSLQGQVALEKTIALRRSVRKFSPEPLSAREIGQLLWAAQGVTDAGRGFRAAPSAGATYPLEVYVVNHDGISKYLSVTHSLSRRSARDIRVPLSEAAYGQPWVQKAPLVLVLTAVESRTTGKYGKAGRGYVLIEVGHAAQNIHLQAVALGMGSVPVGAFDSAKVSRLLGLTPGEKPLYLIPVGRPAERLSLDSGDGMDAQ